MRTTLKTYRYRCDETADGAPACNVQLDVLQGQAYPHSGYQHRVETADDADWVAKGLGWHYAGSKAYCPLHRVGRR